MKILCVADTQDPLVYSNSIKQRFSDIDIILGAGDLPLDYYGFIVSSLNKPLLFIFGNHNLNDLGTYKREYQNHFQGDLHGCNEYERCGAIFTGGRVVKINRLLIAGLGGCMRYNDGLNQYTDFGMWLAVLKLVPRLLWNRLVRGRFLDVMLTHAPPRGIHEGDDRCHRGFASFLWLIKTFKPKLFIHGHTHLYSNTESRESLCYSTRVINAYSHVVLDFEET